MALGTAATIGLALAGSAAANAVGAKVSSNSAKKAAQTQQVATDKAMAVNDKMWEETKALHAPYLAYGNAATNTLGRLLLPPSGSKFAAPALTAPAPGPPMMSQPTTARRSPMSMGSVMYGNVR